MDDHSAVAEGKAVDKVEQFRNQLAALHKSILLEIIDVERVDEGNSYFTIHAKVLYQGITPIFSEVKLKIVPAALAKLVKLYNRNNGNGKVP